MAYGIYSEDFLAICLFMVNGNISTSLLDLIETVELFQKKNDSYYGTIDSDFRSSLLYLCMEHNLIKDFPSTDEEYQVFDTIPLKEIILPILTKYDIYFNDSEAYWDPVHKGSKRLKNYDEMFRFFSSGVEKTPDEVRSFLEKSSWSPSIMADCLADGGYIKRIWDNSIDWDELKNALEF